MVNTQMTDKIPENITALVQESFGTRFHDVINKNGINIRNKIT